MPKNAVKRQEPIQIHPLWLLPLVTQDPQPKQRAHSRPFNNRGPTQSSYSIRPAHYREPRDNHNRSNPGPRNNRNQPNPSPSHTSSQPHLGSHNNSPWTSWQPSQATTAYPLGGLLPAHPTHNHHGLLLLAHTPLNRLGLSLATWSMGILTQGRQQKGCRLLMQIHSRSPNHRL
ncbi:hypothetical protein Hdeb2414_s0001g00027581 [Helianthus debilis subsp. tardiflorus]